MCGLVEQFYSKEVDEKQRVAGTSRFLRPDAISGCFFTPFAPSALGLFISCVSKKKVRTRSMQLLQRPRINPRDLPGRPSADKFRLRQVA